MSTTYTIHPVKKLQGNIQIPASKSHAQRVLALALINIHETYVTGIGDSDDEKAALDVLNRLGAQVEKSGDSARIKGVALDKIEENITIHFGESGLSSRMFTPILSNISSKVHLDGSGSLLSRPMDFFQHVFDLLKVDFSSNEGKLPFTLSGPIHPASITVDGSLSSQFITGIVYGFIASKKLGKCTLHIQDPTSIPYIELSLHTLRQFGVELEWNSGNIAFNGPYSLSPTNVSIEGDWSSASFFLVAAALMGEIHIPNLSMNSFQADKALVQALQDFGAELDFSNGILVRKRESRSFEFDATHCPDLFPPLAVLAAKGTNTSKIKGVHRLTHKESNRTNALLTEFKKMGVSIEIIEDTMHIHPCQNVIGAIIDTHHDHRIAMACAILGLTANSPTQIENPMVVSKSFPSFYKLLEEYCENIQTTL